MLTQYSLTVELVEVHYMLLPAVTVFMLNKKCIHVTILGSILTINMNSFINAPGRGFLVQLTALVL